MKTMTASSLSKMLIIGLGLLLCALVGGSVYAATSLSAQSKEANQAVIDADVSNGESGRLEELKQYLIDNKDGVDQTAALTRGLGTYDQSTIFATVNGYASKAGVTVSGFDFGAGTSAAGVTTPIAGATSTGNTINLTLASPVKYTNFIVVLRLLEQGLMPAQITSGNVSGSVDDSSLVIVSPLTIKVTG